MEKADCADASSIASEKVTATGTGPDTSPERIPTPAVIPRTCGPLRVVAPGVKVGTAVSVGTGSADAVAVGVAPGTTGGCDELSIITVTPTTATARASSPTNTITPLRRELLSTTFPPLSPVTVPAIYVSSTDIGAARHGPLPIIRRQLSYKPLVKKRHGGVESSRLLIMVHKSQFLQRLGPSSMERDCEIEALRIVWRYG